MRSLRHHALQRLRVLFVVALTLVPLALSGHFHTATKGSTPDACGACVVKHHSRAASFSQPPVSGPVLESTTVVVSIAAAPAHVSLPFRTGRAPPALFSSRKA